MFLSNRICCTRPSHVSVGTIFGTSRYMYSRNTLLIRLLKTLRPRTTSFFLFGAYHTGAAHQCDRYKREIQLDSVESEREGEMAKWLEREFTDWKVSGSNPTSASQLLPSRLGQPDSIPALVLPWDDMTARLLKIRQQPTTGFALFGAHQLGAVHGFPSTLGST
ncbi:hypothetical protein T265_10016 [Opisthorchis viverrini]|uniref:Uncharacterized protein n=1 Tax=Opisthorchis viverrini TaxID=6198 RepID=A0A074Z3T4_OPIVI|nr:hypothetical protein T265_10016 [Opisthorchis viverrini]KER21741.1 hypothetical protein T265_10016 [Opisthorchis viverrini]